MDDLYAKYAKEVYCFLLSKCYDEHLAEDLMQETFYQAYKSLDRYNGSCKISVWLCQIAKHLWYQHLEKYQGKEVIVEEVVDQRADFTLEDRMVNREEMKEVLRVLHQLPDPMKEVVYLRIMGDLSFKEIGEILGRSENWARVTFFRGKEKMMKELMKDG